MSIPSESATETLLHDHKQLRDWSCFQSAPEMWLKLKGVIAATDYPEQSIPANDNRGYEPYPAKGAKQYAGQEVYFEKVTYQHPYVGMNERFTKELEAGNPIVVSLRSQPGQPWHGYVLTHAKGADFVLFTKTNPPNSKTETSLLANHLATNEKVDCLFMRVAGK